MGLTVVWVRPDIENAKHQCELWFPEHPQYKDGCRYNANNGMKFNSSCDYIIQAGQVEAYKKDTGKDCFPEKTAAIAAEAAAEELKIKKIIGFVIAAIIALILILKYI